MTRTNHRALLCFMALGIDTTLLVDTKMSVPLNPSEATPAGSQCPTRGEKKQGKPATKKPEPDP